MWDTFVAVLGPVVLLGSAAWLIRAVRERRRRGEAGEPGGSAEVALYALLVVSSAILVVDNLISVLA